MCANLLGASPAEERQLASQAIPVLSGSLVSSLHRLKDVDNHGRYPVCLPLTTPDSVTDGAFFVFGDLSIRIEGSFRLNFSLFELNKYACCTPASMQGSLMEKI